MKLNCEQLKKSNFKKKICKNCEYFGGFDDATEEGFYCNASDKNPTRYPDRACGGYMPKEE